MKLILDTKPKILDHIDTVSCPDNRAHTLTQHYQENFHDKTTEELRNRKKLFPNELALGDWKRLLTSEQFEVTRLNCTEISGSSPLNKVSENGKFHCVSCDKPLFDFQSKYKSGSGWPSFFKPINANAVKELTDYHAGYARTDIRCARCGAHLGHMFNDGPPPTGLRYCMNGIALKFVKEQLP